MGFGVGGPRVLRQAPNAEFSNGSNKKLTFPGLRSNHILERSSITHQGSEFVPLGNRFAPLVDIICSVTFDGDDDFAADTTPSVEVCTS